MDELGEVAVRTLGSILRAIAEIVFEHLLRPIAELVWRLITAPYRLIRALIVRWVRWDAIATPLALLCFAACVAGLFYGAVKLAQAALL
jgi:hypothetical protein